jgi:hypothetical protein
LESAVKTGIAKSVWKTLSLPQPPAPFSAARIASLRSDFASADTSTFHGCAPEKRPPEGEVAGADDTFEPGAVCVLCGELTVESLLHDAINAATAVKTSAPPSGFMRYEATGQMDDPR